MMSQSKERQIASTLKRLGYDSKWLTGFAKACMSLNQEEGAQSIIDQLKALAQADRCVDIQEWLEAAVRAAKSEEKRAPFTREKIASLRHSIRAQQGQLFPWRSWNLQDAVRDYLEGSEGELPKT